MNTVTIHYIAGNGNGWHWQLDRGNGCGMSSSEAFATAKEAEKVAVSIARCNEARYEGLLNGASVKQMFRENPSRCRVAADEHEDRGTNWAHNGTYQASLERVRT